MAFLLDPEPAVEIPVSLDLALDPLLTLDSLLVGFPGDARLLGAALPHPVAESLDRADVQALLAEVLSRYVDLGALGGRG